MEQLQLSSAIIGNIAFMAFIGLLPSILVTITSFTRIIAVFSFLKTALGLHQSPSSYVLISLSFFITLFIMEPVLKESYYQGVLPYLEGEIDAMAAWDRSSLPIKKFLLKNMSEKSLNMFLNISEEAKPEVLEDISMRIVLPAFVVSELEKAFEIGFLISLPFLVVDIVVASILMALGMIMLPPAAISLPIKIILFVIADGWHKLVESLIKGYER